MASFELSVTGNVQRVGFRNIVSKIAFELGLNGNIENLPDETVRIAICGEDKKVEEFIKRIKINEWPISVDKIDKREMLDGKIFKGFKIIRGKPDIETSERADEAALYMQKMHGEMKSFRDDTNKNFNIMESKYDNISKNTEHLIEEMSKTNSEIKKLADTFVRLVDKI